MLINWATSLRGKLFLVLASLGSISLLSALVASLWMMDKSLAQLEAQTKNSLTVASKMVSINAEAALMFDDHKTSEILLSSFDSQPVVVGAILFDKEGKQIARYLRSAMYQDVLLSQLPAENFKIIRSQHQIRKHGEYIGKIIVIADLSPVISRFLWRVTAIFICLAILLIALLLVLFLFLNRFNKRLARLARLTQQIHDNQSFDNRVALSGSDGNDELTSYTNRFNAMLDVIQLQTSELEVFNLQLVQQTLHDSMTGLPNRLYFKIRIKQLLNEYHEIGSCFSLISFDIDNFKHFNDVFGHQTGDEVICLFANELKQLRDDDVFFARIGGDEFTGLCREDSDGSTLKQLYQDINTRFREKMNERLGNGNYSCSAGIACLPTDGLNVRDLMKASDVALYQAKALGRNNVMCISEIIRPLSETILNPPANPTIKTFDEKRVQPLFQPIYNNLHEMVGFECFATYEEQNGSIAKASSFIPWLEEEGLISLLDFEMFKKSLKESVQLKSGNSMKLLLFHNFSLDTIASPYFPERIKNILYKYHFSPTQLVMEVTETIQLGSTAIRHLKTLNTLGCTLCIDDFGAGFTNPGYFRQLPWGMVKIDKEYIRNINDPMNRKLIDSLFKIARLMNIKVVAEGVERREDLSFLQENGCDYYQGFYFSRPKESLKIITEQHKQTQSMFDHLNS